MLPLRRRSSQPLPPVFPVEPPDGPAAAARRKKPRHDDDGAICYHCDSADTMPPFARPARVFLLSRIVPVLRRRYCRSCTRHFLTLRGDD